MLERINPTSFNIHHRFLHAAFNVAIKWGYLNENPMTTVKKEMPHEQRLFMTKDEPGSILKLIDTNINLPCDDLKKEFLRCFHLLVIFLVNTGLRRQEAIRLTAANIDFQKTCCISLIQSQSEFALFRLMRRHFKHCETSARSCSRTSTWKL